MFTTSDILLGGVLPAVVAAGLMLAARAFRLRPGFAWPISLAAGCIAGQVGLAARAGFDQTIRNFFPPRVAHGWLPWLIIVAAAVGIVAATGRRNIAVSRMLSVCGVTSVLFLWRSVYVQNDWSTLEIAAWLTGLAVALAMLWTLLEAAPADDRPFVRATLLILSAVGIAAVLGMSGSFTYAQLAGASAAALVGAKLASLRSSYLEGLSSAAGVVTIALGSLLILGYFFAELTAGNAILLTLALLAAGGPLPLSKITCPYRRMAVRAMACLVPLGIALIMAYQAFGDAS